jgi:crossover junction endodeoxyribonuclease RuvC
VTSVLGLDLSLTGTGWAASQSTGTFKTKLRGCERLVHLRDDVLELLDAYDVDLVVIEGYSYNSRNGGERIGELGGVIRVALHERDVPFIEVAPAARSKYATGLGNASKDRVVAAIAARTAIAFETSDECDAWILRAMALDHYGEPVVDMPAKHRETLRTVDWPELAETVL